MGDRDRVREVRRRRDQRAVAEPSRTIDEVFRREKGRVVGALVRLLGSIDEAEESFQGGVVTALALPERRPSR